MRLLFCALLAYIHTLASAFDAAHRLASIKSSKHTFSILSPSVAKASILNLAADLDAIKEVVPWFHCSVQDGSFVPKISFGAPLIAALRKSYPEIILDVKLGCINPENRVDEMVKVSLDEVSEQEIQTF